LEPNPRKNPIFVRPEATKLIANNQTAYNDAWEKKYSGKTRAIQENFGTKKAWYEQRDCTKILRLS